MGMCVCGGEGCQAKQMRNLEFSLALKELCKGSPNFKEWERGEPFLGQWERAKDVSIFLLENLKLILSFLTFST